MSLLIKNGRIVTATDDYVADIFIEGEVIKAIGKDLPVKAAKWPRLDADSIAQSDCESSVLLGWYVMKHPGNSSPVMSWNSPRLS